MSMFPTFGASPDDLNRRYRPEVLAEGQVPSALRWAYGCALLAAILMLTGAFAIVLKSAPLSVAPAEVVGVVRINRIIVAVGNIIVAFALAGLGSQLSKGRSRDRRLLGITAGVGIVLNIVGFFVHVSGVSSIVVVALLAFLGVFLTRPAVNAYIREKKHDE